MQTTSSRPVFFPLAVVTCGLIAAGAVFARAQQAGPERETARAVQELTSEVRQLRLALAASADTTIRGQMLGLSMTLQQSRLTDTSTRLDTVRRELEAAAAKTRQFVEESANLDVQLAQESDPERRKQLEQESRALKQEAATLAAQEQQIRIREAEAAQAAHAEQLRWNELAGRLEQLLKK